MYDLLFKYFNAKTGLSLEKFATFSHYFKVRKVKKKNFLLLEGDICNLFFFVNEGCLRLYTVNEAAQENTRYFVFEGKFGTALSSFIEQKKAFEYIQAIEHSEVLAIGRKDFYHLVDTVPEVNYIYRDILEMAYITSQKRIYGLQGDHAMESLKWLME